MAKPPLRLNLGSGPKPIKGFKSVDIRKDLNPDYCFDVTKFPWPFKNNSVDEVRCSHMLEHIDGKDRFPFFNELYRVMKMGAKAQFTTPAPFTHRYMQDPFHAFPMIVQEFYHYLHAPSREHLGVEWYPITCNFEWEGYYADDADNLCTNPNDTQDRRRHNINTQYDLVVTLKKI